MEELFKICLACTSTPVAGCESLTEEQAIAWLEVHNEVLAEPNECGDTRKYIVLAAE